MGQHGSPHFFGLTEWLSVSKLVTPHSSWPMVWRWFWPSTSQKQHTFFPLWIFLNQPRTSLHIIPSSCRNGQKISMACWLEFEGQEAVSCPVCQTFFHYFPGLQLSGWLTCPCVQVLNWEGTQLQDKASFPWPHDGCPSHKGRHIYSGWVEWGCLKAQICGPLIIHYLARFLDHISVTSLWNDTNPLPFLLLQVMFNVPWHSIYHLIPHSIWLIVSSEFYSAGPTSQTLLHQLRSNGFKIHFSHWSLLFHFFLYFWI